MLQGPGSKRYGEPQWTVEFCCQICGCESERRKIEEGNYPGISASGVHHNCNGLCIV
jgi:hypothetical protein